MNDGRGSGASRVRAVAMVAWLSAASSLVGCRKASEAATEATTAAAFGVLQKYACEDRAEALLARLDEAKMREHASQRATAKGGDVLTLVFAVAAQSLEQIRHGDLSLFCSAKDVKVDEQTQTVTWVSPQGTAMFARFERVGGELRIVDLGAREK